MLFRYRPAAGSLLEGREQVSLSFYSVLHTRQQGSSPPAPNLLRGRAEPKGCVPPPPQRSAREAWPHPVLCPPRAATFPWRRQHLLGLRSPPSCLAPLRLLGPECWAPRAAASLTLTAPPRSSVSFYDRKNARTFYSTSYRRSNFKIHSIKLLLRFFFLNQD